MNPINKFARFSVINNNLTIRSFGMLNNLFNMKTDFEVYTILFNRDFIDETIWLNRNNITGGIYYRWYI